MLRSIYLFFASIVTVLLLWVSIAVHTAPPIGSEEEVDGLQAQLAYLEPRVHDGSAREMQRLFPEGEVFTQALYALGWCNLAARLPQGDTRRGHAIDEARWAYTQLDNKGSRAQFPISTPLPLGAFYAGWRNYVLGHIVGLGGADTTLRNAFDRQSLVIAVAFAGSSSPFLESYTGQAWPADALMALASLRLHEQHTGADHSAVIARWVEQARQRLDRNGLLPHAWFPQRDAMRNAARGSSQALMNVVLPAIDPVFASEQFTRFRDLYFSESFGVPGVREHPIGDDAPGDVDSGPLILGFGPAATIVGAGACRTNGDAHLAMEFEATVHGFGFRTGGEHKCYVFGAMPIADLFMVWCRSMPCNGSYTGPSMFRRFHIWTAVLLLLIWWPVLWRWWRARR
ncbi:MAG: hypothetical protein ABI599_01065 [Flavobacteriales bacterium]